MRVSTCLVTVFFSAETPPVTKLSPPKPKISRLPCQDKQGRPAPFIHAHPQNQEQGLQGGRDCIKQPLRRRIRQLFLATFYGSMATRHATLIPKNPVESFRPRTTLSFSSTSIVFYVSFSLVLIYSFPSADGLIISSPDNFNLMYYFTTNLSICQVKRHHELHKSIECTQIYLRTL